MMLHRSACQRRLGRVTGVLALLGVMVPGVVIAQRPTQTPPARGARQAGRGELTGAAEVQRLFDAYIVIRAQEALKLDDGQFAQFLPKLTALQRTRRRTEQAHNQLVAEMARLTAPNAPLDEAQLREKLKALQELDGRAVAELRKAYDEIDLVLDVRQQARFRVFEVQMERRKLELVLQARRADAAPPKEPAAPIKKLAATPGATFSTQIRVP
jgi:hypothetical protein